MKRIIRPTLICSLAASCLAIAACDNQATKEVKDQAKAIDKSYKAQADLVEASAKNAPDNGAAEAKADALRNEGAAIKDHLEKEAEEVQRDTKSQH